MSQILEEQLHAIEQEIFPVLAHLSELTIKHDEIKEKIRQTQSQPQ